MATVTKMRGKWQCKVRKKGYPAQSKVFIRKADAEAWGRYIETQMDRGTFGDESESASMTVAEMLQRYLKEESPKKASGTSDKARIAALIKALGQYSLRNLTSYQVTQYKRERLTIRSAQTVTHEINLLHRAYVVAVQEWGVRLSGPIPRTKRPTPPPGRSHRIPPSAVSQLVQATESAELGEIILFAVETAMRRSEIARMDWSHVDLRHMRVLLPRTKNSHQRTVPLSHTARAVLRNRTRNREGRVFKLQPDSISQAFDRALTRVKMEHLTFHDLRHEAISRLFEKGLNVIEVARISGHKTLSQLGRYTHLDVKHLGERLRSK